MIKRLIRAVVIWLLTPDVKLFVLPGGKHPERKTHGAIGYDVFLRAIVSVKDKDPMIPHLRKCLFDFEKPPEDSMTSYHIQKDEEGDPVYMLGPGESVLVGIGFVTEMSFPLFYWVTPRSGLSSTHKITVTNAPGTVDPDYRGEAGVLVHNRGDESFPLKHNMRIAQCVFQWAIIPNIIEVEGYENLDQTQRSAGGFGSTGLK